MLYTNKGITYAQEVAEKLDRLIADSGEVGIEDIYVDAFYNCREQGLSFSKWVYDINGDIKHPTAWVYAHRNTDKLTVVYDSEMVAREPGNMFPEDAWYSNQHSYESTDEAAEAIYNFFAYLMSSH